MRQSAMLATVFGAAALMLGACGTTVSGSNQQVFVYTAPIGADITINVVERKSDEVDGAAAASAEPVAARSSAAPRPAPQYVK